MANANYSKSVVDNAVRSEISSSLVNIKANTCPFAIRLAWHASGTYDKDDTSEKSGGSQGATMRFEPEITDGANAGLAIAMEILKPVKKKFPGISYADLWTVAGVQAIKLMGGPDVKYNYGRSDEADGATCPMNGRLPDAALGADHLRDVFYRMGFNDKDIVALSGAHTVGSCHVNRSGFSGPWTSNPLKFDNEYFKNLLNIEWTIREWDGPEQYTDPSGDLMMLPTDIALTKDEKFLPIVKKYAVNQQAFFDDFASAFAKLISLGCPAHCQPDAEPEEEKENTVDAEFRDLAMHGSIDRMKEVEGSPNPNAKEAITLRAPLHKAAFFGHAEVIKYLIDLGADVDAQDHDGDTALHDAAKLGHKASVEVLLFSGKASSTIKNNVGKTAADLADEQGHAELVVDLKGKGGCLGR